MEKGSKGNIRLLVNEKKALLNQKIIEAFGCFEKDLDIIWVSPLENDGYKEYMDGNLLEKLDIGDLKGSLKAFWPPGGAHWDALGKAGKHKFIIEAKGYIKEIFVKESTAINTTSKKTIRNSLSEVKTYLKSKADWPDCLYQYVNRLAYLYFLRRNKIDAYLVDIYFLGDSSVGLGVETEGEWKSALTVVKKWLDIKKRNKLSKYVLEVFIDVKELQG